MFALVSFLVLSSGGQVAEDLRKSFLQAVGEGKTEQVRAALRQHPELKNARTGKGASAVQFAYYNGQEGIAKLILNTRPEIDLPTAVTAGLESRVRSLVQAHLDLVNKITSDGFTPLGLAVAFGRTKVARALLDKGADINLRSTALGKVAPIHSAVFGRNLDCVRLVLEHHADVNMTQEGGFTALHEAAQNGDAAIAALLLKYGAKRDLKTDDGETALDIALKGKHTAVVKVLKGS